MQKLPQKHSKRQRPITRKVLTHKQEAFAKLYAEHGKPAQAYRDAGYSPQANPHDDAKRAQDLLRISHIQARIEEFKARKDRVFDIRDAALLAELAKLAFANVKMLADSEGNPLPPHELPDEVAAAVQEATYDGKVWRYKLHPKIQALTTAAQIKGLVKDKTGQVEVTLNFTGSTPPIDITPGRRGDDE